VFENNIGAVYGNVELLKDLTINETDTLTIPASSSLTIPLEKTLTNDGTIYKVGDLILLGAYLGNLPVLLATIPAQPTSVSAEAGNEQATVSFTAPVNDGGAPVISYTVTSSPGNITNTGTESPITVTGLVNGVTYTFTVTATNAIGTSLASSASNSIMPEAPIVPASSIQISGGNSIITKGGTLQLSATVLPEGASQGVSWTVDNANIATVNSSTGLVTAKADGGVKVTATTTDGSGVKAERIITVTGQKKSIAAATVKAITDKPYTGRAIKPALSVKHGSAVLKLNTHYEVEHSARTAVGKATITITGKGDYTGTKTVSFKIVPKTTSVSKVVAGKRQIKIGWGKVSGTTKYEVRYRVKGSSAWKSKTAAGTSSTLTVKSLKKGKAYEVQVRSYKTVSGVKYYSAWSKTKVGGKVK
jgi:acylphosphatase